MVSDQIDGEATGPAAHAHGEVVEPEAAHTSLAGDVAAPAEVLGEIEGE